MKTYIVLIPLADNRDARSQCEMIENLNFSMPQPTAMAVRDRLTKFLSETPTNQLKGIEVEPLTDFMDRVNDQEFDDEAYFMSYVNVYPFKTF